MLTLLFTKLFQNRNQIWTFYAQMARLLSGFAFIGLLASTLPSELLGTWYIFISLFGVASLVEMGLGQVIGRHAAYLKADYEIGRISSADFLAFAKLGEKFYLLLSLVIGVIAVPIGLWWLEKTHSAWTLSLTVAWLVYVAGGMLTLLGVFYAALVNGAGEMWQAQRAAIFAVGVSITVLLLLLALPNMLLIPAFALFLSQLLLVVLLRKVFFKLDITKDARCSSRPALINVREVMLRISGDAAKMLLLLAAYQLLTNGFVLVLSTYLGQKVIGSYGLTMQMVNVVMSLSMIWSQSNFFEMAATRQNQNALALRKIFFDGLVRALGVALIGVTSIFFLGPALLEFIGSNTKLLQPMVLALVLCTAWLEFTIGQFAQLLIARGDMRIAYISLSGAIMILGTSFILLSGGGALVAVFLSRIILFACIICVPILLMAKNLLLEAPIKN